MAKKAKVQKMYFVLGKEASIFWDPKAQLKVMSKDQSAPDVWEGEMMTKQMELAVQHGHIIKLDAPAPKADKVADDDDDEKDKPLFEGEATEEKLMALDDAQLEKYYQENFEVSKKDLKKFQELDKAARVKFLLED